MASHAVSVGRAAGAAKPRNVRKPRVRRSGRRLACAPGRWTGDPIRYAYRWRVDGGRATRATGRTMRVTRSLRGRRVQCGVTARNRAGSTTTYSAAVRVR